MTFAASPFAVPVSTSMARYSEITMDMSACRNTQTCGTRLAQILKAEHPFHTAKLIGRDIGIPARTVERWLDGSSSPSLDHFARLVRAYPSSVLALGASWLEAALLCLEHLKLEEQIAARPAKRQRAVDALRGRR